MSDFLKAILTISQKSFFPRESTGCEQESPMLTTKDDWHVLKQNSEFLHEQYQRQPIDNFNVLFRGNKTLNL